MITSNPSSRILGLLAIGTYLLITFISLLLDREFSTFNARIHDYFFKWRHELEPRELASNIVYVDIDDRTHESLKKKAYDWNTYAKIVDVLNEVGARAILFDILFLDHGSKGSEPALVESFRRFGYSYLPVIAFNQGDKNETKGEGMSFNPEISRWGSIPEAKRFRRNYAPLEKVSKGLGHIVCYPDFDGTYRRIPLLYRYGDDVVSTISLRLACDMLQVPSDKIIVKPGDSLTLPDARLPDGRRMDLVVPVDEQGRAIINYQAPMNHDFSHYSALQVLRAAQDEGFLDELANELEGQVVVLSDISTLAQDYGKIPFEDIYPKSGIHANLLHTFLTGDFLSPLPRGMQVAYELILLGLLLLLARKFRSIFFAFVAGVFLMAHLSFSFIAFAKAGVMISPLELCLSIVLITLLFFIVNFLLAEKEKENIRSQFSNYMAPEVLEKILQDPDRLQGVSKKELTIVFSDIVGFTPWSSQQSPDMIHGVLNEYFENMSAIVFHHQGTIDKFMGDGMMIFFGDPNPQRDHAQRALNTAIAMQETAVRLAEKWKKSGIMDLQIRVGMNTGEVVVENMGSRRRLDYTVIGSAVNLAQRMESAAPKGGIFMSESTFARLDDQSQMKYCGEKQVKGLDKPVKTYRYEGREGDPNGPEFDTKVNY